MTILITIDDNGNIQRLDLKPIRPRGRAVKLTPDLPVGDLIFIRPDWPAIGSPDFAAHLRAWHAQHNPTPEPTP